MPARKPHVLCPELAGKDVMILSLCTSFGKGDLQMHALPRMGQDSDSHFALRCMRTVALLNMKAIDMTCIGCLTAQQMQASSAARAHMGNLFKSHCTGCRNHQKHLQQDASVCPSHHHQTLAGIGLQISRGHVCAQ